jgi:hypothetical protein
MTGRDIDSIALGFSKSNCVVEKVKIEGFSVDLC